jgi:catechol 2,3-dioxygenase
MNLPATIPYSQLGPEQIGIRPPAFKLPDSIRLGVVTLQIASLERSLEFYTNIIGFHILKHDNTSNQQRAMLGLKDGTTLLELREKPGVHPAKHRGRLGIYHFALLLPSRGDLGRFIAQALAAGVHVGQSDHHYSEATYLVDPDGISIEVYCDRPRTNWGVTPEGEVIGRGDPLDREALKEVAGTIPWTGLPVGTMLGHLHFYVGDLAKAEGFYHAGLGFTKMSWSYPEALFIAVNGYHHHVGLNTWAAGSLPSGENDARLINWQLILPDATSLDALADNLKQHGILVEIVENGFTAKDPWGICVHALLETRG